MQYLRWSAYSRPDTRNDSRMTRMADTFVRISAEISAEMFGGSVAFRKSLKWAIANW